MTWLVLVVLVLPLARRRPLGCGQAVAKPEAGNPSAVGANENHLNLAKK
jgi:hypothetical protein